MTVSVRCPLLGLLCSWLFHVWPTGPALLHGCNLHARTCLVPWCLASRPQPCCFSAEPRKIGARVDSPGWEIGSAMYCAKGRSPRGRNPSRTCPWPQPWILQTRVSSPRTCICRCTRGPARCPGHPSDALHCTSTTRSCTGSGWPHAPGP